MAQLITQPLDSIADLSWLEAHWGSPVKRLFWIRGVPAHQARGGHRHPSGHMALCCVWGSVEVYVQTVRRDQGYRLQTAAQYLLLAPQDWRLMYKFSVDAVLLVLAQQPYALTHYIDEPYRPLVCAQLDGLLPE